MADHVEMFATAIWRKAWHATRQLFPSRVDQGHVASFVALRAFEVALEGELERGPEIARSMLTSMLADVARNLSRDGRTVKINLDWRETEEA
jgi:hypothetical protein